MKINRINILNVQLLVELSFTIDYVPRDLHTIHVRKELSPHAYATSAQAYKGLRDNNCDQRLSSFQSTKKLNY